MLGRNQHGRPGKQIPNREGQVKFHSLKELRKFQENQCDCRRVKPEKDEKSGGMLVKDQIIQTLLGNGEKFIFDSK